MAGRIFRKPKTVQMQYIGMDVVHYTKDAATKHFHFSKEECCIVPQSCRGIKVVTEDGTFILDGRQSPILELTDFLYVGKGVKFSISVSAATSVSSPEQRTICICKAFCDKKLECKYGPVSGIQVELRGRGQASRQINNFMSPSVWKHADKLCCVEVLTPDGNWSSYPPHKHDDKSDGAINEEIYYFDIDRTHATPFFLHDDNVETTDILNKPYAFHRTFTTTETHPEAHKKGQQIDDTVTIYPGDIYLVPRGYHGPCVTPPGYNLYYLNVLSGPNPERSMAFCWQKEQEWLTQGNWRGAFPDRRLPLCRTPLKGEFVIVCQGTEKPMSNLVDSVESKVNSMVIAPEGDRVSMRNGRIGYAIVEPHRREFSEELLLDVLTRSKSMCLTLDSFYGPNKLLQSTTQACVDFCQKSVNFVDRKMPINLFIDGQYEGLNQVEYSLMRTVLQWVDQVFAINFLNFRSVINHVLNEGFVTNQKPLTKFEEPPEDLSVSRGLAPLFAHQRVYNVSHKGCEYITKWGSKFFKRRIGCPHEFVANLIESDCRGDSVPASLVRALQEGEAESSTKRKNTDIEGELQKLVQPATPRLVNHVQARTITHARL